MRRWGWRVLFWLSWLGTPATLLTGLFLLNTVNPMALAFLTEFHVFNNSGEPVKITPVGAIGKRGERRTLPLSLASRLCIPSPNDRSFPLVAGAQRSFTYDWDDIQFSEILVVPASGEARELVVDASPTENQYHRVATNQFVIPELKRLPLAKAEVAAALATRTHGARFWGAILLGLLPPVGIMYSWRKLRACARLQPRSTT